MADLVRDFALDEDGDMAVSRGDRTTVAGVEAVKQGVKVRVRTFLAEIFLNQALGVDYLNQVLIKNPDPLVVRELIQAQVLAVPDVTEVVGTQMTVDRPTRTASIRYRIRTTFSQDPVTDSVTVEV